MADARQVTDVIAGAFRDDPTWSWAGDGPVVTDHVAAKRVIRFRVHRSVLSAAASGRSLSAFR